MESRWIYREVESEERHGRLPEYVYPHTILSKTLRFDVAEIRDTIRIVCADYGGKAAWYSKKGGSSGVDKVNEARRSMYEVLPYVKASRSGSKSSGSRSMSDGEKLMWQFIREQEAAKKAGAEDGVTGNSEG